LHTKAAEVTLTVPKLRTLPFETAIIERYKRRESSVGTQKPSRWKKVNPKPAGCDFSLTSNERAPAVALNDRNIAKAHRTAEFLHKLTCVRDCRFRIFDVFYKGFADPVIEGPALTQIDSV
jgi:hypothetical protein